MNTYCDISPAYTFMNHFKFGYDGQWYVPRTGDNQKWQCEYGIASENLSINKANKRAALLIQESAKNETIYLLLSGGADSEVAARSFLEANVPFVAAVLKYKIKNSDKILNYEECRYADMFCEKYNIPKKEYILNPIDFWDSTEFQEIVTLSQTRSPMLACTMWLAKQLDGFVVLGQGEPFIYGQFGEWWFREREVIVSWYKYWMFSGIKGVPGFHQYTPEQMLAYLTDPIILELVNSKLENENPLSSNADIKHALYQKHYPESDIADRKKYTGFENLAFVERSVKAKLIEQFPFSDAEFTLSYKQMIKNLQGH